MMVDCPDPESYSEHLSVGEPDSAMIYNGQASQSGSDVLNPGVAEIRVYAVHGVRHEAR